MTARIDQLLHAAHAKPRTAGLRHAGPTYARIVVGVGTAIGGLLALGMIDSVVSGLP